MSVTTIAAWCWMAVVAGAAAASGQEAPTRPGNLRRDLLVITLDTTRRDYLGCYGREPSRTLVLDYLAQRSVVFEDAVTTVPVTLPAHASLFTGLWPTTHGVRYNSGFKLPEEARTLAEILHDAGYATRADVAAFVLDPTFGLAQGFDRYRAPPRERSRPGHAAKEGELPAAAIVDRVLEDVAELAPKGGPADGSRKPFFLWAHFYDPHLPYTPKKAPQVSAEVAADPVLTAKALYEQELFELDAELGRLFRELATRKVMDELVVVIASDHGEGLGDAYEQAHGFFLFDPTVRVPLILRHSALPATTVKAPVSLVDVTPTLLKLLGVDASSEQFDGIDLLPWIADADRAPPDRALHLESMYAWLNFGWAPQFGCTHGPLKYLRSTREELYDRVADPSESQNLFAPGDARAVGLARHVDDHLSNARPLARAAAAMSDDERRRLEALGYAAGGGSGVALPDDWTKLPDPYAKIGAYERMNAAIGLAAQQGIDAAVATLRAAAAEDPGSAPLHEQIGLMLLGAQPPRHAEAAAAFDAALKIDGRRAYAWFGRAPCAEAAAEEAHAQAAAARKTGGPRAARSFVDVERKSGELAETALRQALECDASYPDALDLLSRLLLLRGEQLLSRGDKESAAALLREADGLVVRLQAAVPPNSPDWADAATRRIRVQKQLAVATAPPPAGGGGG